MLSEPVGERIEIALEPPAMRDPRIPNTLYRITVHDASRETALKVVDVLLNSFVEGTMGSDRTGTATARSFLREQLAEYGKRLADAEDTARRVQEEERRPGAGRAGRLFPAPHRPRSRRPNDSRRS